MKTIGDYIKEGWVAILRTGKWTDRRKREQYFDEGRLQRIADNYNSKIEFSLAPITADHDFQGTIPLGKIERLKKVGQYLLAKPKEVATDIVKILKNIGYKYISSSISPKNTLKHLALVSNPAVAGLGVFPEAAMNFSQPEEDSIELLIEFSALENDEEEEDTDDTQTNEKNEIDSNEKEEKIMFTKKKKKPDEVKPEDQDITEADASPGEENQSGDENIDFEAAMAYANEKAEEATKKANSLEIELGKMKVERQQKEVAEFCDSLNPGVIIPKYRPGVERMLNVLAGLQDTYDFSAGQSGTEQTPYEFAKEFFSSLESQIPLEPLKAKGKTGDDDEIEFSDADEEDIDLHLKVRAIMNEEKCSYEEALLKAERR